MFFDINQTIELNKKLKAAGQAIDRLCRTNLIHGEQDKKAFVDGIKHLQTMNEKDLKRWQEMTPSQIDEARKNAATEEDKRTGLAIHMLYKSMQFMSDIKFGTDTSNVFAANSRKRQKEYHADNNSMVSNDAMIVQSVVNAVGGEIDLGYLAAYNTVDARNARELRVSDLIYMVRFMELKKGEEPVLSGGFTEQTDPITGNFYGAAVSIDDRDSRFMPVSANALLQEFRRQSEHIISHVAYKEIFMHRTAQLSKTLQTKQATTGNDDAMTAVWLDIVNARYTLNEATRELIDAANLVSAGNKKTQNRTEVPKNIPASTPIIVYYNHAHQDLFADIMSRQMSDQIVQTGLYYNYQFVSTTKAPLSGAWASVDEQELDDYLTYGTVKEKSTKDHKGVKIVIPRLRNIAATFEALNFEQDRRSTARQTVISARQMFRSVVDNSQLAWVKLS